MRNSVLGVLGEMVLRVLSGDDLDPKHKSTRDQFLDKLEVIRDFFMLKTQLGTTFVNPPAVGTN